MNKDLPQIPVKEIFSALRKCSAGKYFLQAPRYSHFRKDHESLAYWKRILGPSAIIFSHLQYMHKIVSKFLQYEVQNNPKTFSQKEQYYLLLASVCHDFGEAIIDGERIGDVQDPLKPGGLEQIEFKIFRKVLNGLYLNQKLKKDVLKAYQQVVFDKNSHLYIYFRSIELLEYIMTALNVVRAAKKKRYITHGKLLVGNVLAHSTVKLMNGTESLKKFYSLRYYCLRNASLISAAFRYSADFHRKAPLDGILKTTEIAPAVSLWESFLYLNI